MDLKKFYSDQKRLSYNPSQRKLRSEWKRIVFSFDDRFLAVVEKLKEIMALHQKSKIKLLDVGIGDAVYEHMIPKVLAKKIEIYGVDISIKQLKRAGKFIKEAVQVDLNSEKLPYNNAQFDVVLVSELLEHVFFPEKVLAESIRVLKKNGYLILTYPNSGSLQFRLSLLFWGRSPLLNYPENAEHIRFFNKKDILTMMDKNCEIISYQGLSSFLFAKWNFPVNFPTPRLIEIFGNKILPNFALGNMLVIKK